MPGVANCFALEKHTRRGQEFSAIPFGLSENQLKDCWLNSRVVKYKLFTRVTLLLWSPAVLLRIQILFKPNTEANLSTTIGYASSKWRICNNFLALPLFPPLLSVSSAPPPSVCPPFPSSFPISVKMCCIVGSFTSSFPCTVMPCIECYCNLFVTF